MALLTGSNKINIAVFISGTGSNLKSLIKFSKLKKSPIIIKMIISNNHKAKGLQYANIYKIKKKVFDFKNTLSEKKVINELKKNNINLICLAGFMKILSKNFIKNFKGKILNIHPSLLPKFKGLNTHERVINKKEKYSGCTVHFVNFYFFLINNFARIKSRIYKVHSATRIFIFISNCSFMSI